MLAEGEKMDEYKQNWKENKYEHKDSNVGGGRKKEGLKNEQNWEGK